MVHCGDLAEITSVKLVIAQIYKEKRPVQIGNDTNWTYITCNGYHSKGIKSDGSLWTWGQNNYGQLGDGTNTNRFYPVKIVTDVRWKTVKCGFEHSFVLYDFVPILISPANKEFNVQTDPIFQWKKLPYGITYTFQLSAFKDFSSLLINESEISTMEYQVVNLAKNTKYYWRVKAFQIECETDWSDVWEFTTEMYNHSISLFSGWNLISTYVEPEKTSLENIFSEIEGSTVII